MALAFVSGGLLSLWEVGRGDSLSSAECGRGAWWINQPYLVFLAVNPSGKNVKYFPHILPAGGQSSGPGGLRGGSWFSTEQQPHLWGEAPGTAEEGAARPAEVELPRECKHLPSSQDAKTWGGGGCEETGKNTPGWPAAGRGPCAWAAQQLAWRSGAHTQEGPAFNTWP